MSAAFARQNGQIVQWERTKETVDSEWKRRNSGIPSLVVCVATRRLQEPGPSGAISCSDVSVVSQLAG